MLISRSAWLSSEWNLHYTELGDCQKGGAYHDALGNNILSFLAIVLSGDSLLLSYMDEPKTLEQAIQFFSDPEKCRQFMIAVRWEDGPVRCPRCGSKKVSYLAKARLYRCYGAHPRQKFSLKVGTVFEDSLISLEKWLPALWLLVNSRNEISSYEISRAIGVTQKSAWFMLHRIRLAMQNKSFAQMGNSEAATEVDKPFIGGKPQNMHCDNA
jgi:transposase-like protein